MNSYLKKLLSIGAATVLTMSSLTSVTYAQTPSDVTIAQGAGDTITKNASFSSDVDPNLQISVDVVMKIQNKSELERYINNTVTPGNFLYRKYIDVTAFRTLFAPRPSQIALLTLYLNSFGIKSKIYSDNLIITATGTAAQINKAFGVELKNASYKGKSFHASKTQPKLPKNIADNILCVLGLSDYSSYASNIAKIPSSLKLKGNSSGPLALNPSDLIKHYDVSPLYEKGSNGANQNIGIVTLAEFNPTDAYSFWKQEGITTSQDRIKVTDVDGGSGTAGADETTLDVEQSGALAPGAGINVYVGPNSDPGFIDTFAKAINDNKCHQISVSWGLSESILEYLAATGEETNQYAEAFNQLYMQAAAQGISMFAAAGDAGAYDTTRNSTPSYELAVDNPADSPYITAAGGTTLPWQGTFSTGVTAKVEKERAWGWDYLYPVLDSFGFYKNGELGNYFVGGGGGFSKEFSTPNYQKGVSGVNSFSAIQQWIASNQQGPLLLNVTRNSNPTLITGKYSGRNVPDISMAADPFTGYNVYIDGQMTSIGGTSIVAPQLAGLCALINNHNNTQVGFWNPQIYKFAQHPNSPLNPLNDTGSDNDNIYYTGTKGTVYNQATGLGIPDVAKLAEHFGK